MVEAAEVMDIRERQRMLRKNIAGLSVREWLNWLAAAPVIITVSVAVGGLFA